MFSEGKSPLNVEVCWQGGEFHMQQQQYKVEVSSALIKPSDESELQQHLNKMYLEGWKLQSVTPQLYGGTVQSNVYIFERRN